LLLAYVCKAAFAGLAQIWSHEVGYGVVKDVRTLVYDHIQRLSLRYFQDRQTGKIMAPATSDVATLELLIAHAIRDSVLNGLVFVGASIILLRLNWQLGLLVMLPVPLILYLARRTNRRARRAHRQVQDKLADPPRGHPAGSCRTTSPASASFRASPPRSTSGSGSTPKASPTTAPR
jgi:ATP-binding cassette subfamily B protein